MSSVTAPFNRKIVQHHRDRAANNPNYPDYNFLFQETAERLHDRMLDVARQFHAVLDLGCHGGELSKLLPVQPPEGLAVQCDLSEGMMKRADDLNPTVASLVADEEWLPFKEQSFDLVLSNLSLHWVNDLPGALIQIRRALKDDGLFLGCMLGGDTLTELRQCLMNAESEITGGVSPRISPFADVRDLGGLLQRAGFTLPVADSEPINVSYEHAFKLFADLRGMGETNAIEERLSIPTRRDVFMKAATDYQTRFADASGRINASFEVIFLHGWTPHESQQQPLKPGSAKNHFSDFL